MFPIVVGLAMVVGVAAGWLASILLLGISSEEFVKGLRLFFTVFDVRYGLVKSASFGTAVGWIGCMQGLGARGGAQGVGKAATSAVVYSAVVILVLDAFWAVVWLLGEQSMKRANDFAVGLTILVGTAVLIAATLWVKQADFGRDRSTVVARFHDVGGVRIGTPVVVRGVRAGRVEGMELADSAFVLAKMALDPVSCCPRPRRAAQRVQPLWRVAGHHHQPRRRGSRRRRQPPDYRDLRR
jgi:hypothetical protein